MPDTTHAIHWLQHAKQRLGLLPTLGGGVAAWQLQRPHGTLDLWRPWMGDVDRYSLASFAMVPWSNRISGGGFDFGGVHHPIALNREGEPYPIHGDGWLQKWVLSQPSSDSVVMHLESNGFAGNPYQYLAEQRFVLREDGMDQTLCVTHRGERPLPYGLGQHPWFVRDEHTQLQADVSSVWLSANGTLSTVNSRVFPSTWDLRAGIHASGNLIDNVYAGWSGAARITWPSHKLALTVRVAQEQTVAPRNEGYCLLYRPSHGSVFCFEPVTHPIDAFHLPHLPGLRVLQTGESMQLHIAWRFDALP